jgi:hypothetical protein
LTPNGHHASARNLEENLLSIRRSFVVRATQFRGAAVERQTRRPRLANQRNTARVSVKMKNSATVTQ